VRNNSWPPVPAPRPRRGNIPEVWALLRPLQTLGTCPGPGRAQRVLEDDAGSVLAPRLLPGRAGSQVKYHAKVLQSRRWFLWKQRLSRWRL